MEQRASNPATIRRPLAVRLASGCAALVLLASAAGAQTRPPVDAGEEGPPRYTVELIVFAYDESVPSGNEVFVPDEPLEDAVPVFSDGTGALPDDGPRSYGDGRWSPYPEELPDVPPSPAEPGTPPATAPELPFDDRPPARQWIQLELHDEQQPRMNDIYGRLVTIDAYRPLMRAAWTQTTHARDDAPAIHLQSLGGAPPGLDGSVTLYVGRFVHLVLDLALDAEAPAPAQEVPSRGDDGRAGRYGSELFGAPVRYRLEEDRIMRMGEIRYFDHPRFGVIARVTAPKDGEQTVDGEPREAVSGSD